MANSSTTTKSEPTGSLHDPAQWLEEHGDILYRYACRYFQNDSLVEDLVQDTFLAAIKGLERFKGNSSVRTWLIGILKHKIYDQMRNEMKMQELSPNDERNDSFSALFDDLDQWANYEDMRPWGQSPDRFYEQKEFLKVLDSCSQRLPQQLRQVQIMRDVEDISPDEVCKLLGLSKSNVRVVLHRARLLLRDCLEVNWRRYQPEGEGYDFL